MGSGQVEVKQSKAKKGKEKKMSQGKNRGQGAEELHYRKIERVQVRRD